MSYSTIVVQSKEILHKLHTGKNSGTGRTVRIFPGPLRQFMYNLVNFCTEVPGS